MNTKLMHERLKRMHHSCKSQCSTIIYGNNWKGWRKMERVPRSNAMHTGSVKFAREGGYIDIAVALKVFHKKYTA